jgi:hypothetical protein
MAVQERKVESSLDRYIAEVRAVWGDGKDPQLPFKVAALMEKLFASTSPDDPWMAELIRDGKPSRELYRDPDLGFIQMGHIHKQGHGNTPHDHGPCWVSTALTAVSPRLPNTNAPTTVRNLASRNLRKTGSIVLLPGWSFPICAATFIHECRTRPGVVSAS